MHTFRRCLAVAAVLAVHAAADGGQRARSGSSRPTAPATTCTSSIPRRTRSSGVINGIEVNHGAAVAPDGSRIYVSNEAESTLDVVDAKTLKVIKKVPLSGHPNNIAVGKDGKRVYVGIIQAPGGVDVIDTASLKNVKTMPTKGTIHNAYVTPDGKYVVAGLDRGQDDQRDRRRRPRSRRGRSTWTSGVRPMAFAANADGSTKWIFVAVDRLQRLRRRRFRDAKGESTAIKNPDLPPGKPTVPEGSDPSHGMAVTADGKTLVVCSRLNNYLYSYSLPDLKLARRRRARRQGRGMGDAHAGRQDGLRGQPGDQRRVGRRHQDHEGSRADPGRLRAEAQHHRLFGVSHGAASLVSRRPGGRVARRREGTAVQTGRVALLRRRSRRHEVLGADRHQRRERAAAAAGLAVEALGNAARGIQDGAGFLREHAAHDRRRAVRDDAVQQHRGARRRNRQGALAVRRRGLQARPVAVRRADGSCAARRSGATAASCASS